MISGREIDDLSTITTRTSRSLLSRLSPSTITKSITSSFENDLQSSRVYRKASCNHSQTSLTSSARFHTALSVFSGFTLAQVSTISVFALPVYPEDLYNSQWYTFGDARAGIALANKCGPRVTVIEAASTEVQLKTDARKPPKQETKQAFGSHKLFNQRLGREIAQNGFTPAGKRNSRFRPTSSFPDDYVSSMHYIGKLCSSCRPWSQPLCLSIFQAKIATPKEILNQNRRWSRVLKDSAGGLGIETFAPRYRLGVRGFG